MSVVHEPGCAAESQHVQITTTWSGGRQIGGEVRCVACGAAQRMRPRARRDTVSDLRGRIDEAIEASDNDGGSASDAIQDMLAILHGDD